MAQEAVALQRVLTIGVCLLLLVFAPHQAAHAAGEQHYEDEETPSSVDGYQNPVEEQFKDPPLVGGVLTRLRKALEGRGAFLEETELKVKFRSYYMYGKLKSNERREAFTYGGWIEYKSGYLANRLRLGASFYASQKLSADTSRDGTLLLRSRQRPFSVFGESYAQIKLAETHSVFAYRKLYDLPYLNKRDNRMAPVTFEGYAVEGDFLAESGYPKLHYIGGWLSRFKERNSDRFISMGEGAGTEAKRGLAMFGALYYPYEGFSFGVFGSVVPDVLATAYGMLDHTWSLSDDTGLRLVLQHTRQQSHGDDLLTGSYFRTRVDAGYAALSYRQVNVKIGFSTTGHEAGIRSPFGSRPSPLSLMINDFDRAQEDAWLVGVGYQFEHLGLPGLSGFINYARGNDAHDNDGNRLPDQDELDVTLDYRIRKGRFEGLWVRVRGAFINERGSGVDGLGNRISSETQNELRVIVNYDFNLL